MRTIGGRRVREKEEGKLGLLALKVGDSGAAIH